MTKPSTPAEQAADASRRSFLRGSAVGTASVGLLSGCAPAPLRAVAAGGDPQVAAATAGGGAAKGQGGADAVISIHLQVNGKRRNLNVEPRTTLVEAVRDQLGLTGTKIGCNHGQCGACTVLLDGRRVNSCLVLAVQADGAKLTTIEGLAAADGTPHPMQQAFSETDAFQCGYCTPGQILSAVACIEEGHAGSASEIREYMSGNLCRCAAYPNIVAAVEMVRDAGKR